MHGIPETIARLQIATKTNSYEKFKEYTKIVDEKPAPIFIRDLMDYKRNPIDISESKPVENIMKRFVTGAMSYSSISREAHEAMAMAMNKIGGQATPVKVAKILNVIKTRRRFEHS